MIVKIGEKIFDSKDEPIMIVVQEGDKHNLYILKDNEFRLCFHSGDVDEKELEEFMKLDIDPKHGA